MSVGSVHYSNLNVKKLKCFQKVFAELIFANRNHCVKSVRILNFSGSYSVRMQENSDQKNLFFESSQTATL